MKETSYCFCKGSAHAYSPTGRDDPGNVLKKEFPCCCTALFLLVGIKGNLTNDIEEKGTKH